MALYGYDLFHKGTIALSEVESNGIRVDVKYCKRKRRELLLEAGMLDTEIQGSKAGKLWAKHFGAKTNYNSRQQLAKVLFGLMGHVSVIKTATGKDSASEEALAKVDDPVAKWFLISQKLKKCANTYLDNIILNTTKGILHPFFHLHFAASYRSSSSEPNFQNFPVRDEFIGKLIREAFRARPGRCLVEVDYSAIEVRVAACYHKDPTMLEYINDPTKDMHSDMASECFMIPKDQVTKEIRYFGKNCFVFPQFYGSVYQQCAPSLWEARPLEMKNGMTIGEHLMYIKGIHKLGTCSFDKDTKKGTFEDHIRKVSDNFWNVRFPVYSQWKRKWYSDYLETGEFHSLTGFKYWGIFHKNQVINYPIQGSAFHCLLLALIYLQRAIRKHHKRTLIVGQIHDSIVADVPENEMEWYLDMVQKIMVDKVGRAYSWLIVPLEVEAEASGVEGTWYEKERVL